MRAALLREQLPALKNVHPAARHGCSDGPASWMDPPCAIRPSGGIHAGVSIHLSSFIDDVARAVAGQDEGGPM